MTSSLLQGHLAVDVDPRDVAVVVNPELHTADVLEGVLALDEAVDADAAAVAILHLDDVLHLVGAVRLVLPHHLVLLEACKGEVVRVEWCRGYLSFEKFYFQKKKCAQNMN